MRDESFQAWIDQFAGFTADQQAEALRLLNESFAMTQSVDAVERNVSLDRQCRHCGTSGAHRHGLANGLQRYRCAKGCGRTFNAASGTVLEGLHHKDKWGEFVASQTRGESLRKAAKRCGISLDMAFRWRHRMKP